MKHFLPALGILSLSLISLNIEAQTVINGDFENWEGAGTACEDPVDWDTPNDGLSLFGLCSVLKEEGSVQNGGTAVRLVTTNIPLLNIKAPAAITTGEFILDLDNPFQSSVGGGTPIWGLPDAFMGYYDYVPNGGDSLTIQIRFFDITGSDTTMISEDEFIDWNTTGGYTAFNLPINYMTSDDPELMQILIRSTRDTENATAGSTLYIDNLSLSGISSANQVDLPVKPNFYPNPVRNLLYFDNDWNASELRVFSILGNQVAFQSLGTGRNQLDMSSFKSGIYIYQLVDSKGDILFSGRISKVD
jgi:hypothetical protein